MELDKTLETAWTLIEEGVTNRNSSFHTPTLASIAGNGYPSVRTMVLRGVNIPKRFIEFHTDRRSPKYTELSKYPESSVHFYDPSSKTQITLRTTATLHYDDSLSAKAWASSKPSSKLCYTTANGPGANVDAPPVAPSNADAIETSGYDNFCLVQADIQKLEWLRLFAAGHRRAIFTWPDQGKEKAEWIAP